MCMCAVGICSGGLGLDRRRLRQRQDRRRAGVAASLVIGPVPDLEAFLMRDPCHARPNRVPVKRKASPMIRWIVMVTSEFEANRWQEGNVRLREGNMVTSSQKKKEWLRTDCIW